MKRYIEIYDTTLRDGSQGEDLSFSVEDKIRIAKKLDSFGIDFIEAGWPGSNPKDEEFFAAAKKIKFKSSRLAAFGATRRASVKASQDPNLKALIAAQTPIVTIFGKSWDMHVKDALKISLDENVKLIEDSVAYLKKNVAAVFYDAEHFFDGFIANPNYAVATLKAAYNAGASRLVLCETNGGRLPYEIADIIAHVQKQLPDAQLGIHCHNDAEMGVANSLAAIRQGALQVHGTVNGYGERCGNANLCSIIPAIALKMGLECGAKKNLQTLRELSHFVSEIANLPHRREQPYVGESAFAHKGGIHVSAILKNRDTYEHIHPEWVGNHQRVLISDLSGESNLLYKAKELGIMVKKGHPRLHDLLGQLKTLENIGYQFEAAEASFEILLRKTLGKWPQFFQLIHFRTVDTIVTRTMSSPSPTEPAPEPTSEATIKVRVAGKENFAAAEGVGPVHALDRALRQALEGFYPQLRPITLKDYKVRVLSGNGEGTSSMVRVLIEFEDPTGTWRTVGVSPNVIQASYQALVDGIEYKLFKEISA